MSHFSAEIVEAVLRHMNDDHAGDSLVMVRAAGHPDASSASMIALDEAAGMWLATEGDAEHRVRIEWPDGKISERREIREQIVKLTQNAYSALGIEREEARENHAEHGHDPHDRSAHHGGHAHAEPHTHAHGTHKHGAHPDGDPISGDKTDLPADAPFSEVVRRGSWGHHSESEGSGFMSRIFEGQAPVEDYAALVAQHYFLYVTLEEASQQLNEEGTFAKLNPAELQRVPALEIDLAEVYGSDWQSKITELPASRAYSDRIREIAAEGWIPGIIAHHYTRYLGDLSGGQMIAEKMKEQHGFTYEGVAFYDFTSLGSIPDFKAVYRDGLDELGERLSPEERERFMQEVRIAYEFNTAVFNDLAEAKAAAAG